VAARYQQVLAEWKACEVVVRQREREAHPATLSKFSSGSSIDSHVQRLIHRDSTISNDVSLMGQWGGGLGRAQQPFIYKGPGYQPALLYSLAVEPWVEDLLCLCLIFFN
jgi:hypothetical protein